LVTGTNPGKHGVFDFFGIAKEQSEALLSNSTSRRQPALWQLLSAAGCRVGILNVPLTYPPEKVNGFMVSGMDSPRTKRAHTYPEELARELSRVCGRYIVDIYGQELTENYEKRFRLLDKMMESRRTALFHLMRTRPWDFLMAVFVFSDRLQHNLWSVVDSSHPRHRQERTRRYAPLFLQYFQWMDRILGEILEELKGEVNLIIVSDHGFGPCYKSFSANNFLQQIGVLKVEPLLKKGGSLIKTIKTTPFLYKLVYNLAPLVFPRLTSKLKPIFFQKSKAYMLSQSGSIYINLKGRQPFGLVEPGKEYEDLRNYIMEKLYELKDPETQKPIVGEVYKKEEIYTGPYIEMAPDLIFQTRGREYLITYPYHSFGEGADLEIVKPLPPFFEGDHRMQGVFMAYGPDIAQGKKIEGTHIMDVAPTVLHLMGQPVPESMDGRVLRNILSEEFDRQNLIRYQKIAADQTPDSSFGLYSDKESELIRERLKGMGYIT
jgi:predicted AlkP superfamily phosphohydrolase/phosphomutase